MFPQAPLRSRTAGFPRSGSDLGCPFAVCPRGTKRYSRPRSRPAQPWFTIEARPFFMNAAPPVRCLGPVRNRQVPRVPSPNVGIVCTGEMCTPSPARTLLLGHRSYGLIRQSRLALLSFGAYTITIKRKADVLHIRIDASDHSGGSPGANSKHG